MKGEWMIWKTRQRLSMQSWSTAAGFDWPRWKLGRHSMSRPTRRGEGDWRRRVSRIHVSTMEGVEVRRVWIGGFESKVME